MKKTESLDLGDAFGKDQLSSALGVGTDAVGALWKQLKEHPENSRQLALETLAKELSRHYPYLGMYSSIDDPPSRGHLASKYMISPRIVDPLVSYYRTHSEQGSLLPIERPYLPPIERPYFVR